MRLRWRLLFFCFIFLALVIFGWWGRNQPWLKPRLVQPLAKLGYVQFTNLPKTTEEQRVFGFLPYWTLNQATISGSLTDIAYFSIGLDANGRLIERDSEGNRETGLYRLQQESFTEWLQERHAQGQRVHITVTAFDADTISALITNPTARRTAVDSLTQLLASYPFDGIQMDFEYAGEVNDTVRARYVDLMSELNIALEKIDPSLELSIAVFGSAASKYTFWDTAALHKHVDFIIVMAYDYHVRSSDVVGPIAPIFGRGKGRWEDDVVSNMRDLLHAVPANKLLLGIPFYGYEWTSTSDKLGAATYPSSGVTATYQRVVDILSDPKLAAKERWDEDALAPYVTYKENGYTQFIYYENTRSLSYKLDFVEQLSLGGIAIWALGYEGGHPELWEVIGQKIKL